VRIAFPILRLNWYRIVAPIIDEALKQGHQVECWHNRDPANWASNSPDLARMPAFQHGSPTVRDYSSDDELKQFFFKRPVDAAISIALPPKEWLPDMQASRQRPLYGVVSTPDTLLNLLTESQMAACDVIALRSEYERESAVLDHTAEVSNDLAMAERRTDSLKTKYVQLFRSRMEHPWNSDLVNRFREKSALTGYPMLDAIQKIDKEAVRSRWKIPTGVPVVGLWAAPYLGRGFYGAWDRIFTSPDRWRFAFRSFRAVGVRGLLAPYVNEISVVHAVRDFCDRNHCLLATKMRHYQPQNSTDHLYAEVSDRVVGEERHYPHSAMELAAISKVMIGFYTTGTTEAIASGAFVLDVNVPGSQRDIHERASRFFGGMFDWPGAVTNLKAEDLINQLPHQDLERFEVKASARNQYMARYCGPMDGCHSARVIRAVEWSLSGSKMSDLARDEQGFVRLNPSRGCT
jgi:hypothetical protein